MMCTICVVCELNKVKYHMHASVQNAKQQWLRQPHASPHLLK